MLCAVLALPQGGGSVICSGGGRGAAAAAAAAVVVGYIIFSTNGINAHLSKIAVREDMRRCGVGSALLRVRPN